MAATYFAFGTIRKYILTMLKQFNGIKTQRYDEGQVFESIVPIVWGSKERLMHFLDPAYTNGSLGIKVPKMALTLDGMEYDPERKTNKLAKKIIQGDTSETAQYNPVPYVFSFRVHIITRTLDDYFQILEQIIPYYPPSKNVNVNEIPGQDSASIKIVLRDLDFEPDIEYSEEDEIRTVNGSISFSLYGNIYMPVKNINLIQTVYARYFPTMNEESTEFDSYVEQTQ